MDVLNAQLKIYYNSAFRIVNVRKHTFSLNIAYTYCVFCNRKKLIVSF